MSSEIVAAFERIRRDAPDRQLVYLPASDTALSAQTLWEAAQSVIASFDQASINPRGLVLAALGNRPAYLASFLACLIRRQSLCPLDAGTPAAEVFAIATHLGASAVLTFAGSNGPQHRLPTASGYRTVDHDPSLGIRVDVPVRDVGDSRHGDVALLKMTSGSTGTPRATLTPEHALVTDTRSLMSAMHVGSDDVQVAAIPLSHAYGIGNLVVPVFLQGTPIVLRDSFVPQRLPEDARRYAASTFPGVPFMFDHFVNNPPAAGWPPELRNLMSAGALLETRVAQRFRDLFGVKVHAFYGTSETGGITYDDTDNPATDGLVGTPLPGVELELVGEEGAPDGGGRVLVRGPAVIQSYADNADAASFVAGGFLTGDLGVISASGELTLTGRVSSFVNVAGRKVQPEEVERVLRGHANIVDVRVLGVADERRGEHLVACLVTSGGRPSVIEMRRFCGAQLASHKIPRAFVFVDAIPLTERGKTDRSRLRALVGDALSATTDML